MNLIDRIILEWSYRTKKGYPDIDNEEDLAILESFLGTNLFEAKLNVADLTKPFPSRHELHGMYKNRGERFLEKIKKQQEFELVGGGTAVVDIEKSGDLIQALEAGDYSIFNRGAKVIFTTDGEALSLSNIEKTAEFGSGAGSGGGAQNTRIQESAMCVVCAIAYKVKGQAITSQDITVENISEAMSFVDIDATESEVSDFILQEKSWLPTFVGSANLLQNSFRNSNFTFHRGSDYTNNLYKAFNKTKKQANVALNNDKWNPADIWLVDPSITAEEIPDSSLDELNGFLVNSFTDNRLVGVSLKKTGSDPKLSIVNLSLKDFKGYKYEGFTGKLTNNNITVIYDQGKITFRTFNHATNFAGEIQGKTASHGKIGSNPLNDVLRGVGIDPLPNPKEVQINLGRELKQDNTNTESRQKSREEFIKLMTTYIEGATEQDAETILDSKDDNYIVSKYLSMSLLDKIERSNSNTQNEIISDMIRYASSATKNSSVHAKVS